MMKIKTFTTIILLTFTINVFSQTINLDPDAFARTIFKIIQTDDFAKMTSLIPTSADINSIISNMEDSDKEETKQFLQKYRKQLIPESRQGLTKIRELMLAEGIIIENAKNRMKQMEELLLRIIEAVRMDCRQNSFCLPVEN